MLNVYRNQHSLPETLTTPTQKYVFQCPPNLNLLYIIVNYITKMEIIAEIWIRMNWLPRLHFAWNAGRLECWGSGMWYTVAIWAKMTDYLGGGGKGTNCLSGQRVPTDYHAKSGQMSIRAKGTNWLSCQKGTNDYLIPICTSDKDIVIVATDTLSRGSGTVGLINLV